MALTVGCHLLLGWAWGITGGVLVGWLDGRGGWWKGGLVVAAVWAGLIGYSFVVAAEATTALHDILAGIAGGVPSGLIPLLVVGIGGLIGVAGGLVGSGLHRVLEARYTQKED